MESEPQLTNKKDHSTRDSIFVFIVLIIIIGVVIAIYFGLRNNESDTPDEITPDPDIVEPGPAEEPDGDDDGDGEPEHTHTYGDWQYDGTYHWKECSECGEIGEKAEHTLGEQTRDSDGNYYQTCSICGYTTTPVEAVPTSWKVETTGDLIIETTNSDSGDPQGTLNLDEYVSITIYDQYGGELSGDSLDSYTLTVASGNISVNEHIVTSTTYETGAASVTLTSSVISGASETLSITLTQKTYNATEMKISQEFAALKQQENESVTLSVTFLPEWHTKTPDPEDVTWTVNQDGEYVSLSATTGTSINVKAEENGPGVAIVTVSAPGCNSVTCTIANSYDFKTDSWEVINAISTGGVASQFYSVGDTKTISIRGEEHDIRIDDFDHDILTISDENYDPNYNDGVHAGITVEMTDVLSVDASHPPYQMNSTGTNAGGWDESELRNTALPELYNTLDSDLQSVIKMVDKVAMVGGGDSTSPAYDTKTSSDNLFILANAEVTTERLGNTSDDGYEDEGTIYAYWSQHTSQADRCKLYNGGTSTVPYYNWWLRSAYPYNSAAFIFVEPYGYISMTGASVNCGMSFAFCI